jgi:WD repeat-containing protein 23
MHEGENTGRALLKVYDINMQALIKSIPAHTNDINSIAYVDRKNSAVFISGSDDCRVKIWDTRALGIYDKPAGYFLGHISGITNVASREDGCYVASNGKD